MSETTLQIAVSDYVNMQYPDVIFTSDASGLRLRPKQYMELKRMRSDNGLTDVMIFEPKGGFKGLFIELKKEGESPYKLNGELRKNEHLEQQAAIHERLNAKGYFAQFCTGFDEAKALIDKYMRL